MIFPSHGGQLSAIARAFGVPVNTLRDFSANINPDGPPPSVLTALRKAVERPETLTEYPDLEERDLKGALASYANCDGENVLVGNGFVPLLQAVVRTLGIRSCLLPVPSFSEYRASLNRENITVQPLLLHPEQDFRYDIDALLASDPEAILLANPQNPSGVLCQKETMLELIGKACLRGTYVLLDEAFIDYDRQASVLPEALSFSNLVVFRSVTKCFGIPGLRVAYAIASVSLRQRTEEKLQPWPVSTLASIGVVAAVRDETFNADFPALNRYRRSELTRKLFGLGLYVYPSAANFLLFRLPEYVDEVALWRELVVNHGLVLRSCIHYECLPLGHLRVAVKDEVSNLSLIDAMSRSVAMESS